VVLSLTASAATRPHVTGISWFGQAALNEILAISRTKLQTVAPAAYIFRVHIDADQKGYFAAAYYRTGNSGAARHLLLREVRGHWRVTEAPAKIDYETPDEAIITGSRNAPKSNQAMQPTAGRSEAAS